MHTNRRLRWSQSYRHHMLPMLCRKECTSRWGSRPLGGECSAQTVEWNPRYHCNGWDDCHRIHICDQWLPEEDSDRLERLGLNRLSFFQRIGHWWRKHFIEQSFGLLFLLNQLVGPLVDNGLQVGGIALHHIEHIIHDVILEPFPHRTQPTPNGLEIWAFLWILSPTLTHCPNARLRDSVIISKLCLRYTALQQIYGRSERLAVMIDINQSPNYLGIAERRGGEGVGPRQQFV